MLKKQLLAAMEGKHRDAKPKKRREQLNLQAAATEAAEVKAWTCKTCDVMVEAEGDYCRACAQYWQDVENGIFDDQDYGEAYEQAIDHF